MATPFLGQVSCFAFLFPPKGWALCNGQTLPINQNQALFALLGTTYGGNGQTTFNLPDLRGKIPIHRGKNFAQGTTGGEYAHALQSSEMSLHTHAVVADPGNGGTVIPTGNYLGAVNNLYGPPTNLTAMHAQSITPVGGGQPHENMQPYLGVSFCIALVGIFPSRN